MFSMQTVPSSSATASTKVEVSESVSESGVRGESVSKKIRMSKRVRGM